MNNPLEMMAAYFEGKLNETQVAELQAWLREDRNRAKAFVRQAMLDSHLTELLHEQNVQDISADLSEESQLGALLDYPATSASMANNGELPRIHIDATKLTKEKYFNALMYVLTHTFTPTRLAKLATAAVLLLGTVLAIVVFTGPEETDIPSIAETPEPPASIDDSPESTPPAQPPVATITATHNAVWASPQAEGASAPGSHLSVGSPLHPNQRLTLTQGFAEITTHRGAVALVEAPATIELDNNNNAIKLHSGKLVGICETPSSKGFLVRTPHMDIIDLGTRFGVETNDSDGAYAEVFEGEISLVASVGGAPIGTPVQLRDRQAARVTPYSSSVESVQVQADRFASLQEHEASRIARGEFQGAEAVRKRWQEHDELLAAVSFSAGEAIEGYGFQRIYAKNLPYTIAAQSLIPPHASQATQVPGRIVFGPGGLTNIFGEFDFSPDSALARSGLLTDDGLIIGRTSRRVCLSWVFNLEEGTPSHESWFLFSLYAGGEHHLNDVVLAMGKNNSGESWGLRHLGTDRVLSDRAYLESAGARLPIEPGEPCRWLAVIDFDDLRGDRIAIYFNPDPSKPLTPNYEANNLKLAFDRISIEAGRSQCRWSADEVRIGTTIDSVLLNE